MALRSGADVELRPLRLLKRDGAGQVDVAALNAEIPAAALADPRTPRWVAKPTVAYLWAHGTVQIVPRYRAAVEDPMAVPQGWQARAADNGAERGP